MAAHQPWPRAPWIRGWHLQGTIPLTNDDLQILEMLVQTYPGGPPTSDDWSDLLAGWLRFATLPQIASDPRLSLFGWWFFLSLAGHQQLWRTWWKVLMRSDFTPQSITLDFRIRAIPRDAVWMRGWTTAAWIRQLDRLAWPDDPAWRREVQAAWA